MRVNHTNNDREKLSSIVNKEESAKKKSTKKTVSLVDEDHLRISSDFVTINQKQDDNLINKTLRSVRFGMRKHSQTVCANNIIKKSNVSLVQEAFSSAEEFLTFATTEKKIRLSDQDVVQFLKQARSSLNDGHKDAAVLSVDLQNMVQSLIKEK